jgi:hypothetical protein
MVVLGILSALGLRMTIDHSGCPETQGKCDQLGNDQPKGEHMAILSQQAHAHHRGVDLSAARKAIQSDRIPTRNGNGTPRCTRPP